MQKFNTNDTNNNNKMWHSPLSHSLPYMNSYDSSSSYGMMNKTSTSTSYHSDEDEQNEMMYPFNDDIHNNNDIDISPNDDITIDSSSQDATTHDDITSTSTSTSNESDHEIDDIRRAIEITFGTSDTSIIDEQDDEHEQQQQQQQHPRNKFLGRLGIGMKQQRPSVTIPTRTPHVQKQKSIPTTPPTSPIDDTNDDSLDAMLALMGISESISTSSMSSSPPMMRRSNPINIPMKTSTSTSSSRPIPIKRTSRLSNPSPLDMLIRTSQQQQQQQQHITSKRGGWDSDDDDSMGDYFDGPQSEDLSGSMLFDY